MRGYLESNHAEYLDNDRNLLNLHLLVVSETWLTFNTSNEQVIKKLKNWKVIKRLDATDNTKHMGLMLLAPIMVENIDNLIFSLDYVEGYRNDGESGALLYQGIILDIKVIYKKIACLYIRQTPNQIETEELAGRFKNHDCIIGDLNLNPAVHSDKSKLLKLCEGGKFLALKELTHVNGNQLEHVILDQDMIGSFFSTSYVNFASDHKSIVIRMGQHKNQFCEPFLERVNFDNDHHLRTKVCTESENITTKAFNATSSPRKNMKQTKTKEKITNRKRKISQQEQENRNIETYEIVKTNLTVLCFENPPGRNLCFSNSAISCVLNIPRMKPLFQINENNVADNSLLVELSNK